MGLSGVQLVNRSLFMGGISVHGITSPYKVHSDVMESVHPPQEITANKRASIYRRPHTPSPVHTP